MTLVTGQVASGYEADGGGKDSHVHRQAPAKVLSPRRARSSIGSAFSDSWLRLSRTSQPKTRTMIKCSRRKDTDCDHASTPSRTPTAAQSPCAKF